MTNRFAELKQEAYIVIANARSCGQWDSAYRWFREHDDDILDALAIASAQVPMPPFCSQCGRFAYKTACGPTHAIIAHEWETEVERVSAARSGAERG